MTLLLVSIGAMWGVGVFLALCLLGVSPDETGPGQGRR